LKSFFSLKKRKSSFTQIFCVEQIRSDQERERKREKEREREREREREKKGHYHFYLVTIGCTRH